MTISATGLPALALADFRTALSLCAAAQVFLEVDGEAVPATAALALIHLRDAGEAVAGNHVVLHCYPGQPDFIADDATAYSFRIEAEFVCAQPSASDDAEQDFTHGDNLADVVKQLRALYDDHSSGRWFDLAACGDSGVVREDDTGDGAGEILNLIVATLECVDA